MLLRKGVSDTVGNILIGQHAPACAVAPARPCGRAARAPAGAGVLPALYPPPNPENPDWGEARSAADPALSGEDGAGLFLCLFFRLSGNYRR